MKLAEGVPFEVTPSFLAPTKLLSIPPQKERFVHEGPASLRTIFGDNKPRRIVGVRAHMHKLGVEMKVSVNRGGKDACLVDIPQYDFDWQTSYFLIKPVDIMTQDTINIPCVYNSTSEKKAVYWGEDTEDEMCLTTIYSMPR